MTKRVDWLKSEDLSNTARILARIYRKTVWSGAVGACVTSSNRRRCTPRRPPRKLFRTVSNKNGKQGKKGMTQGMGRSEDGVLEVLNKRQKLGEGLEWYWGKTSAVRARSKCCSWTGLRQKRALKSLNAFQHSKITSWLRAVHTFLVASYTLSLLQVYFEPATLLTRAATTPGTSCPTLFDKCVGSLTSHRILELKEFWGGTCSGL